MVHRRSDRRDRILQSVPPGARRPGAPALGARYIEQGPIIRAQPGETMESLFGNVPAMRERAQSFVNEIGRRLEEGQPATRAELLVYEDLSLFLLYGRYMSSLDGLVSKSLGNAKWDRKVPFWKDFLYDFQQLLLTHERVLPSRHDPKTIFAGLFQIERAFAQIYHSIIDGSMPAARLRASVWESIFTRDMRRYLRSLYRTMAEVPTLILGPSGSGKELVARAIGLSCFIPFDPATLCFRTGDGEIYVPLNLTALAPTLIESELFGHVKGAFTFAHKDHEGWLKRCGKHGAVFLDEIRELDPAIQVKLLRVLETRKFQRVGDAETIDFEGKIIAATNRDLAAEMHAGRFRHDLSTGSAPTRSSRLHSPSNWPTGPRISRRWSDSSPGTSLLRGPTTQTAWPSGPRPMRNSRGRWSD